MALMRFRIDGVILQGLLFVLEIGQLVSKEELIDALIVSARQSKLPIEWEVVIIPESMAMNFWVANSENKSQFVLLGSL